MDDVLAALARDVAGALDRQLNQPGHPEDGGIVQPDWGLVDPGHVSSTATLAGCAMLVIARPEHHRHLISTIDKLAAMLLRVQRDSGLIDLRNCNPDSAPDTAFVVQLICAVLEQADRHQLSDAGWDACLDKLREFARRAVPGIIRGGFHTPNHRWVIAGALAFANTLGLSPDRAESERCIDSLLAETIDIDDDGFYSERSVGVYDAVANRSLTMLIEHAGRSELHELVRRNLHLNRVLLNRDGTADTSGSTRQDRGLRIVPLVLVPAYLQSHAIAPDESLLATAQLLWRAHLARPDANPLGHDNLGALVWTTHVLLKYGQPRRTDVPAVPQRIARWMPREGLWRVHQDDVALSVRLKSPAFMSMRFRSAELLAVRCAQTYMGVGRFVADEAEPAPDGSTIVLRSRGDHLRHRPGYELSLGRPVRWDDDRWWERAAADRTINRLAPADTSIRIAVIDDGVDLHVRSNDAHPSVPAQLALDFPPGGIWETGDCCFKSLPGQVIFLRQSTGRMRYGSDFIEVSPGCSAHYMWQMRDTDLPNGVVRVLLTFMTPLDHTVHLRTKSAPLFV